MGKSLIITEKPSVAQEFAKVLRVSGRNDGYIENGEYVISWCVGHLVTMSYPDRQENGKDKTRTETVTIDESLKSGDGVAMIRADGGQSFYIFEKLGG